MEELIKKAQDLVQSLTARIRHYDEHQAIINKQQTRLDAVRVELDTTRTELVQREVAVEAIEDIGKMQRLANQSKAEADSEWNKIRGEWDKLDQSKAKQTEESRIEREDIKQKLEFNTRVARENQDFKESLDERAQKIKAVTEGV